jgi:cellulose synthase/poly-beta-1,6-N-acetylglucosamine synthase-like glycosyltransferase
MPPLLLAYAAASLLVLLVHAAGCAGLARLLARERRGAQARRATPAAERPSVEIVVAARDEEAALPGLLASLERQTDTRCTFLFVDDRSSDGTAALLARFRAAHPARVRVLTCTREPAGLTGKQAALDLAIREARGDVLLFTDADCVVPPGWAEELGSRFADPAVGAVLGRVRLEEGPRFLDRFQAFEQPLINQYNLAPVGLGGAFGCFGNNLAVRREAALAVGGFRGLGWSMTEDTTLLTAIRDLGRWKVGATLAAAGTVTTRPMTGWRSYVNQHTRWNAGAINARDWQTRLVYWLVIALYLPLTLVVLPLGLLDWRVAALSLTSFVSVGSFAALAGLNPGVGRSRYYRRLVPYLAVFLFFYSFVTWRAVLARPFDWKGRPLRPTRRDPRRGDRRGAARGRGSRRGRAGARRAGG